MTPSDTGGVSPEDAFEILGHETRLAILHALWKDQLPFEDHDFEEPPPGSAVPFTTLRKRVGVRDGSQFNYHLKKLTGRFVHQTDDGYLLARPGLRILSAVLAGELTEDIVLDGVAIGEPCPLCGEQVVLEQGTDRLLDWLVCRCTACEGGWEVAAFLSGVLMSISPLTPVEVRDREPDEMYRALVTRTMHEFRLVTERVCPSCSGPIRTSPLLCAEHVVEPGRLCETCRTIFAVRFRNVCDVCNDVWISASDRHFVTHPTVHAFYHEHGYEPFGHEWLRLEAETIDDQTVVSADPLEIRTEIEVDGEGLVVTLGETGSVVNVEA